MRVVIAPDSFTGTLTAIEAAEAIATGWRAGRPDDELTVLPMSDGGDGFLDVIDLAISGRTSRLEVEVADPRGRPVDASLLVHGETAYVESAQACGLHHLADRERDPLETTTYGVGQLLEVARDTARRVVVGLGGSATVDGGAGALTALGFRLTVEDGSGLKIGGGELHRLAAIARPWVSDEWDDIELEVLADVRTDLLDAPATFGPQKGADRDGIARLERGLERFAEVVTRDLGADLRNEPGTGAAGGLGFGLVAGLGGRLVAGGPRVARLIGLPAALDAADLLVVGEGQIDATSTQGKVVGTLLDLAADHGVEVAAVTGRAAEIPDALMAVEPVTGGEDVTPAVQRAAERLAGRIGRTG
ncbi:MAG: glycerate kinase [Nitriliruptorales bacterium]|nr:glycerate kinase [Nitriliruptorales bacterium]